MNKDALTNAGSRGRMRGQEFLANLDEGRLLHTQAGCVAADRSQRGW